MRRLVDSLLLVLIAYTLCWPLVRGFAFASAEPTSTASEAVGLYLRVRRNAECKLVPNAEISWSADTPVGPFSEPVAQTPAASGVVLDGVPPDRRLWLQVRVPGLASPVIRVVDVADDRPLDRDVLVTLPDRTTCVVGRARPGGDRVSVSVRTGDAAEEFDVACDEQGRFFFALPPEQASAGTVVTIAGVDDPLSVSRTFTLDGSPPGRVHDVGDLDRRRQ